MCSLKCVPNVIDTADNGFELISLLNLKKFWAVIKVFVITFGNLAVFFYLK